MEAADTPVERTRAENNKCDKAIKVRNVGQEKE